MQTPDEAIRMPTEAIEQQVDRLLRELLRPRNRSLLEQFRFRGSTNRVYRIPLAPDGDQFIVVKLLPGPWVEIRNRFRRAFRNMLYGEHDVSTGSKRVQMEIERAREWRRQGFPVPPLIETALPGVRVFLGLPYPTFYTILTDRGLPPERKLQVLRKVVQALSLQHKTAFRRREKGLVHRDPGPWNIMFDIQKDVTYWFDLEHPAEYPRMTLEELMVRAVRIFLYGVLEHLGDHFDEVIRIMVENYELKPMLRQFAEAMERCRGSPVRYLTHLVRRPRNFHMRQRIARKVRHYLEARPPLAVDRASETLAR